MAEIMAITSIYNKIYNFINFTYVCKCCDTVEPTYYGPEYWMFKVK